jgi:hypothetical protein
LAFNTGPILPENREKYSKKILMGHMSGWYLCYNESENFQKKTANEKTPEPTAQKKAKYDTPGGLFARSK